MSAPSGYTALDFVGFTDKGTYSPIVKYMRNDLVHHGGNIMRFKVDDTMNVTPVEGANWELWIGASANLVERVIAPLENNPADVAFGVGRQIIYDDWLWEVIAPIAVGDALIDYAVDPTNANIKKSAPVETQLLAVKAEADATDNMIAPTETNASSSSAAYTVGDQLILNNILYDVIAAIQIGDALITGTGGNIAAADSLTEQLAAKANSSDLATVATSGSYNDLSNKPTLGTAAAKDSTNAVTSGSTDLVESGAVYSETSALSSSIQTLTNQANDMVNVLGSKNLLPNEGTDQTYRGITFRFLTDGTIVANGTADSNNNAELKITDLSGREIVPRKKTYILTGCPSGGNGKYNVNIAIHNRTSGVFIREIADVGNGAEFTLGNDEVISAVFVKIEKGETVTDLVFAPMIRLASISDDTYEPYAMTNRELTKKSLEIKTLSTGITNIYARRCGNVVMLRMILSTQTFSNDWNELGILPIGLRPVITVDAPVEDNHATTAAASNSIPVRITMEGKISVYAYSDKLTFAPVGNIVFLTNDPMP